MLCDDDSGADDEGLGLEAGETLFFGELEPILLLSIIVNYIFIILIQTFNNIFITIFLLIYNYNQQCLKSH